MNIVIVIEGIALAGTLDDSAAGRDFASLLPLTLPLTDFHGVEKIGELPRRLSTEGAPAAIAGSPGDITYYAPWGNLAFFYGEGPLADGLVRLGGLASGAADALADLDEATEVTIRPAGD